MAKRGRAGSVSSLAPGPEWWRVSSRTVRQRQHVLVASRNSVPVFSISRCVMRCFVITIRETDLSLSDAV